MNQTRAPPKNPSRRILAEIAMLEKEFGKEFVAVAPDFSDITILYKKHALVLGLRNYPFDVPDMSTPGLHVSIVEERNLNHYPQNTTFLIDAAKAFFAALDDAYKRPEFPGRGWHNGTFYFEAKRGKDSPIECAICSGPTASMCSCCSEPVCSQRCLGKLKH